MLQRLRAGFWGRKPERPLAIAARGVVWVSGRVSTAYEAFMAYFALETAFTRSMIEFGVA